MGYQSNVPAASSNKPKAAGFLNISLPNGKGGKRQLGAIFLFGDQADHKQVIDALSQGADINKFKDLLIIDYKPNTPDEDKLFDLQAMLG